MSLNVQLLRGSFLSALVSGGSTSSLFGTGGKSKGSLGIWPSLRGESLEAMRGDEGLGKPNDSFEKLKVAITTAPVLSIVDPNEPFVLEKDASGEAIGVVLSQRGRPVAFESKKLDRAQQNYSAYKQELLVIIHALKKWRHYLYGATFEVQTDHESVKWFSSQSELKGRKARWTEILQEFDLTLRYQRGKFNVVADALP